MKVFSRVTGLIHVTGWINGSSGQSSCEGSGWVRILGDPVGTWPWLSFIAALMMGGIFLVATPYTSTWEDEGDGDDADPAP